MAISAKDVMELRKQTDCGMMAVSYTHLDVYKRQVHNITAVAVGVHHAVHCVDIVLPIAVDGNGDVATALGLHQARQYGVLVAAVAALADADIVCIAGRQLVDNFPQMCIRDSL